MNYSANKPCCTSNLMSQSLAYAGRRTGDLLAALERGEPGVEDRVLGISRELGGIEVLVSDAGASWAPAGEFREAGPIAADQQVIRLGSVDSDDLRVMLRMAQGNWRIDEIRLAHLASRVEVVSLQPDSVTSRESTDSRALERLTGRDQHLVTVPGDAYRIWFTIPEGEEYQLFLDSRGFYYEWVREDWLEDESALLAASVMLQPREALRTMAPGFEKLEPEMERLFWSSRFRR